MNWERFQTYGQSSEKSFEMLCNQLFENWCKEECKDTQSAIDKCSYSSQEYGDIHYYMPSATLRTLLGITDTNGYQYYNNCNIVAEYSKVGERWRTSQEFVLVGKDCLMQKLKEKGLTLILLMQELRKETGNAKERYGDFYAERRQYIISYYKDDRIVFEKMLAEFSQK